MPHYNIAMGPKPYAESPEWASGKRWLRVPMTHILHRRRPFVSWSVTAPPGQEFFYNTGALTLVSAIIRKATGRPLDEFAEQRWSSLWALPT